MLNFDFKKSTRKCSQCEREIKPGEDFYSALIELDDGATERRDFAVENWADAGGAVTPNVSHQTTVHS